MEVKSGTDEKKIVVVGDGAVGKTSMVICYTTDYFPECYTPHVIGSHESNIDF